VSLVDSFAPAIGSSFDILDWGSLVGTFSSIQLPTLASGLQWNTSQLYTTGVLSVASAGIPGDFNHDNSVDAADYVYWRKNALTSADYNLWRGHYGQTAGSGAGTNANVAVPEPEILLQLVLLAAVGLMWRRRAA
jgi:hypothetical protein